MLCIVSELLFTLIRLHTEADTHTHTHTQTPPWQLTETQMLSFLPSHLLKSMSLMAQIKQSTGAHCWFGRFKLKRMRIFFTSETLFIFLSKKLLKQSDCYVVSWTNRLSLTLYWIRCREIGKIVRGDGKHIRRHTHTHFYKRSGVPGEVSQWRRGWHMASRPLHWVGHCECVRVGLLHGLMRVQMNRPVVRDSWNSIFIFTVALLLLEYVCACVFWCVRLLSDQLLERFVHMTEKNPDINCNELKEKFEFQVSEFIFFYLSHIFQHRHIDFVVLFFFFICKWSVWVMDTAPSATV